MLCTSSGTPQARQLLIACPDGAEAQWARLHHLERRLVPSVPVVAVEPLSEREVTVLRQLRGTLSLRDIGRQLDLSSNTVKTHTRAIYRKLGVSTRQDAIGKGHAAGVL